MDRLQAKFIFDNNPLSKKTKSHLNNVYNQMIKGLFITGISTISSKYIFPDLFFTYVFLGFIQLWIMTHINYSTSFNKSNYFYCYSFIQGILLSPILKYFDNEIVLKSLLLTNILFISLNYIAKKTDKRHTLYLLGILTSLTISMLILSVINIFVRSTLIFELDIYLGLLLFSIYVIFDTQMIIKEANEGIYDVSYHALAFYTDFINILTRTIYLLNKKNKDEKN